MAVANDSINQDKREIKIESDGMGGCMSVHRHRSLAEIEVMVDVGKLREQLDWLTHLNIPTQRGRYYYDLEYFLKLLISRAVLTNQDGD